MELNQRESDYLVAYLKEVVGIFKDDYLYIDPNDDKSYTNITAEDVVITNKGALVKYKFENERWYKHFIVSIHFIDFVIFCARNDPDKI